MEWSYILLLAIAIPVVLFPAAFIWYLNIGGIYAAIKEARARKHAREKETDKAVKAGYEQT